MAEEVKLYSRYEDVNTYLKLFDDNTGILLSNSNYTRRKLSEDQSSIQAIDFEGGPTLNVGDKIIDELNKIKTIKVCYYVEFE
jgi:hypothetical protein